MRAVESVAVKPVVIAAKNAYPPAPATGVERDVRVLVDTDASASATAAVTLDERPVTDG